MSSKPFTLEDAQAAIEALEKNNCAPIECSRCHEEYYYFVAPEAVQKAIAEGQSAIPLRDRICKCGNILPVPEIYRPQNVRLMSARGR